MSKQTDVAVPGSLVIAETSTSTWNFHLRRVGQDGKLYLSGAAPPALCGRSLGWDTKQPLSRWGKKSHLPEQWCADCAEVASDEIFKTALLPAMDVAKKGLKADGFISTTNFKSLGTIEGRPRYKTKAAAAKHAVSDLSVLEDKDLEDGDTFLVGCVRRATTFANGCFTEVLVLGDIVTYEMVGGLPVTKKDRTPVKKIAAKRPRR